MRKTKERKTTPAPDVKKEDIEAYMANDDLTVKADGGVIYFTAYARVTDKNGKNLYARFASAASLDADMSIVKNTICNVLKSSYASARDITILTQTQFKEETSELDSEAVERIINATKVIEPI